MRYMSPFLSAPCFLILTVTVLMSVGYAAEAVTHTDPVLATSRTTVFLLTGETQHAADIQFLDNSVRINHAAIPFAAIDRIQRSAVSIDYAPLPTGVLLQDGSWLPLRADAAIRSAAAPDTIHAETAFGACALPLEYVRGWGAYSVLQAMHTEAVSSAVSSAGSDAARDILLLVNGNKIFGDVLGIEAGAVLIATELNDEPLSVPLDSVVALRLRSVPLSQQAPLSQKAAHPIIEIMTTAQCPPLRVWAGQRPRLVLGAWDAVEHIFLDDWTQFSAMQMIVGTRVFVSDLTPSALEERGRFGRVWKHARDHNIDGSPLFVGGTRHNHALVMHSYSMLTWDLNKGYDTFHSTVAISDALGNEGNCIVRVFVDDIERWHDTELTGGKAPQTLAIDVRGATTLRIEVDFGKRYDIGDHCAFASPYLTVTSNGK